MPHATTVVGDDTVRTPPGRSPAESDTDSDMLSIRPLSNCTPESASDDESLLPRDVKAILCYLAPSVQFSPGKPPIQVVTRSSTRRDVRTTVKISPGLEEVIHDVRGREEQFTLGRNGFMFAKNRCTFEDWGSRDGIWTQYIEQLKELVSEAFGGEEGGVDEVIAFHEGKRGANKEWRQATDGQRTNPFARQVHVDQSEPTIRRIVKEKTDIKGDWLWKGRVRQVNAWKPLYHPVYDCGLCVADATTVTNEDLIEAHRIREADGEFLDTMGVVQYRPGREWYYKSRMTPDDVVLFMGYDSDCARGNKDGTGFTLHSAFDIPNPPAGSPPRASIEVRFLVFTWPKEPLIVQPCRGILTAQAPPRMEELYESHHTDNLEVIEEHPHHLIRLPDEHGVDVEVDLNDYDPLEPDMLMRRRDSAISTVSSISPGPGHGRRLSLLSLSSPSPSSPSGRRSNSISLEDAITEPQLTRLANDRVAELERQIADLQHHLQAAQKTRDMVGNPMCRKRMLGLLNERRTDELGRQRLELARRLRLSLGDIDL